VGQYAQRPAAGAEQRYGQAYEQLVSGGIKITGISEVQTNTQQTSSSVSQSNTYLATMSTQIPAGLMQLASAQMNLATQAYLITAVLSQILAKVGQPPQVTVQVNGSPVGASAHANAAMDMQAAVQVGSLRGTTGAALGAYIR